MRQTIFALAALAVFASVATSSADVAAAPVTVTGSYLVGSPVAYYSADACTTGTNNIDSSCRDIPPGMINQMYSATADAALDSPSSVSICFYSASGIIGCDQQKVPPNAQRFSVTTLGGAAVDWTVTFG